MCLYAVTVRHKPYDPRERWACKVFGRVGDDEVATDCQHVVLPRGKWVLAHRVVHLEEGQSTRTYPSGFHVWATRNGAEGWAEPFDAILRVKVRGIKVEGKQRGRKVLVAREIFIPKPKRPPAR